MLISRTPLRISFLGGGTDLPSFYRQEFGAVVSAAINKYVYISAHPYFYRKIHLKYSKTETVDAVSKIESVVFRKALEKFRVIVKSSVSLVESSGDLVVCCHFDNIVELDSGYHLR